MPSGSSSISRLLLLMGGAPVDGGRRENNVLIGVYVYCVGFLPIELAMMSVVGFSVLL